MKTINEISKELKSSKQNINQILKRSMRKLFIGISELNKDHSPFEIAHMLAGALNVYADNDFNSYLYDFPDDIRKLIIDDAISRNNSDYKETGFFLKKGNINKKELMCKLS